MQQVHDAADDTENLADFSQWETIKSLVKLSDGKLTENQIRWALRFKKENGLDKAVTKFGHRIYVHVPTFMRVFTSGIQDGKRTNAA